MRIGSVMGTVTLSKVVPELTGVLAGGWPVRPEGG